MQNDYNYDYIIIGAGPSGLSLAHILPDNKKILIIERNSSIGGCHRVDRVQGLFTEHGPRIYSYAYVNFNKLLKEIRMTNTLLKRQKSANFYGMPLIEQMNSKEKINKRKRGLL